MENNSKTYEVCPYCGREVELDAELKVQVCPGCGKHIVTCSMCVAENGLYCRNCALECLAHKLNEKEYLENEIDLVGNKWRYARKNTHFDSDIFDKFYNTDVTWKVGNFTEGVLYMNNEDGEMYLQQPDGTILYCYI